MKEDCDTDDNIEIPTNNTDVVNLAMIVLYRTIKKYTEDKYFQYGNILFYFVKLFKFGMIAGTICNQGIQLQG